MNGEPEQWWSAARRALPSVERNIYLNTGTCGPLPAPALQAMREEAEREFEEGRIGRSGWERAGAARAAVRSELAAFFGGGAESYALQSSTTAGVNAVVFGMDWQPGDEVITTASEHAGLLLPLGVLRARRGVVIRRIPAEEEPARMLGRIESIINNRTRLIALSHVVYNTGARLPVEGIIALAHSQDLPVLLDGAQSAGAFELDLPALGVDFYALPGQKWLLGPEGTGALYVAAEAVDRLQPARAGYLTAGVHDQEGYYLPHPGALRFEVAGSYRPLWHGWLASLRWLRSWGLERVYERQARMASAARRMLQEVPGLRLLTPQNDAGLFTFTLDGVEPEPLAAALAERGILIRTIPEPSACRISVAFFHVEEELERLCAALAEIGSRPPGAS